MKGYEHGKPAEITQDVWDGLIRYWNMPPSIRVSNSCSASCLTKDEHVNLPMLHSTGQKPHAGIRLDMVIQYGSRTPVSFATLQEDPQEQGGPISRC